MPRHPDDSEDQSANFFQRWSDRKTNASQPEQIDATKPVSGSNQPEALDDQTQTSRGTGATDGTESEAPLITEADLDNLTYDSDYTKFMGEQVPEALRRRALRQLWRSDPILANLDGLCDYDDDFTDAALAVTTLQTAHKVGQGYLTDDEVAANRARGEPAPAETTDTQETEASDDDAPESLDAIDDSEDIEVVDPPEEQATVTAVSDATATNTEPPDTPGKSDIGTA